jgi:SagB-type dehydrogenase family enzyme
MTFRATLGMILLTATTNASGEVELPSPTFDGTTSVEKAIYERRSVRRFASAPLSLAQVSQLLWSAQGTTSPLGYRTAPSAGALYPLETYLVAGNVTGLEPGVYRYTSGENSLEQIIKGDHRKPLMRAASNQSFAGRAPASIILTAVFTRVTNSYGRRGTRYVNMEAGHAAQNVYLQAVSLELGTVVVGAFSDDRVRKLLQIPVTETPLYIMPIGKPASRGR